MIKANSSCGSHILSFFNCQRFSIARFWQLICILAPSIVSLAQLLPVSKVVYFKQCSILINHKNLNHLMWYLLQVYDKNSHFNLVWMKSAKHQKPKMHTSIITRRGGISFYVSQRVRAFGVRRSVSTPGAPVPAPVRAVIGVCMLCSVCGRSTVMKHSNMQSMFTPVDFQQKANVFCSSFVFHVSSWIGILSRYW